MELTPERYLHRMLRLAAQTGNAVARIAERDGQFELRTKDGKTKNVPYVEGKERFDGAIYHIPPTTAPNGSIWLYFSDSLIAGLRWAGVLETFEADITGKPIPWVTWEDWLNHYITRLLYDGKIWADSVTWEDEEEAAFRPKADPKGVK